MNVRYVLGLVLMLVLTACSTSPQETANAVSGDSATAVVTTDESTVAAVTRIEPTNVVEPASPTDEPTEEVSELLERQPTDTPLPEPTLSVESAEITAVPNEIPVVAKPKLIEFYTDW
jgi:outer membrane biosynthesis protein TonB